MCVYGVCRFVCLCVYVCMRMYVLILPACVFMPLLATLLRMLN